MNRGIVFLCVAIACLTIAAVDLAFAGETDTGKIIVQIPDTLVVKTAIFSPGSDQHKNISPTQSNNPLNTLVIVVLGAILGAVGQGIRVIVGLKKVYDEAVKNNQPANELLQYRQLALSLVIGFAIGAMAGVLAAVNSVDTQFSKSVIVAFIAAGYAGTDFIEGFMKNNPSTTTPGPASAAPAPGPAPVKSPTA